MKRSLRILRPLALTLMIAGGMSAFGQYNIDGSKWSVDGTADFQFSSFIYNENRPDEPIELTCDASEAFTNDNNPNTVGLNLNINEISGGLVPPGNFVLATGALNTSTGVVDLSTNNAAVNITFTYQGVSLTIRRIDLKLGGTISGSDQAYVNGQWRVVGGTITGASARSGGTVSGVITGTSFPWTLTLSDFQWTGAICPGQAATVTGTVNLESYNPGPSGKVVTVRTRSGSVTSAPQQVALDSNGKFQIEVRQPGAVDVLVKSEGFLQRKQTVNITTGGSYSATFNLANGDVDNNNRVDDIDLFALTQDFLSTPGSASGNSGTDLTGDGNVDDFDLFTLTTNFLTDGDQ